MKRIMFVCHGNICRSPMAEFVFKDIIKKAGKGNEFVVASSATSSEEIWNGRGNPVYPPAKDELARHGIPCDGKRAVQLCRADADKYDLFICMDGANVRNTHRILGESAKDKICKLLDFADGGDVADPWYSDRFDVAYADIKRGCEALFEKLKDC